ncbi:cell wall-binding repeat-containing protein [Murdochiella sp. Marseille-P8839]|nr:cell wall-binding repeat-containing protein [Murdochiella sp. Marseille-P8839]
MRNTVKRCYAIAFFLLMTLGLLGFAPRVMAAEGETRATQDEVYFEILPEIFLKNDHSGNPDMPKLLTPYTAVGVRRSADVYGGTPNNVAKVAWENVYFNVYNEDGSLNVRTKGTLGNHGRWGGAKYLGPFEKGKKYTIEVDTSTLPPYYHSWFTQRGAGHFPEYVLSTETPRGGLKAIYDGNGTETYAGTRFHMDIVSFAFVKNEDVGKNQFTFNGEGKVTGRNTVYQEGKDYLLKTLGTDHKLPELTEAEKEQLVDEGNWPVGFYFYYTEEDGKPDLKLPQAALPPQAPFYDFLKYWQDTKEINTSKKFRTSSIFTLVLEQRIPVVSFYQNEGSEQEADNTLLDTRQVYYKHSLADNCLSNGTCLPKNLPDNPTREGMLFTGWNTKPDGTGEAFTANSTVKADMKVYAQWKKPTTPTPKPSTPILRIVKIDGDGNRIPLPVTFKITDKMIPAINRVVTTDKSGEAKVEFLATGDYSLEEIKTPEGYIPLDKPLSFSVKDGRVRYDNNMVRTIYVKNDKKTEEPETPDVIKPIDDPTRQDIAATISKTYFGDARKVILVQNMAYADSMSAMNVSQGNIPILYTQKDALFDVTKQEILRTPREEIVVMGGPGTISEKVIDELKAMTNAKITRVGGIDRFEVNKNSAAYLPESTNAVIASGMIYTDALSSVPYAHQWKAPILLVREDRVSEFVADVLKARIRDAVISGGEGTIAPETKQAIEAMIGKTVSRVDGANRYVVSAKMAEMVMNPTSAILTSGEKWSDALVAGPVAQKLNASVLLTKQANLPMPIDAYLNTHKDLEQILIVGGPASVGESVRNAVKAIFPVK